MKIIYSFWTKPFTTINASGRISNGWQGWTTKKITEESIEESLNKAVKYYQIGAKIFKKLGYSIDLYTDNYGKKLIGDNNIYENIYTDLEDLKDQPTELWSLAKVYSLNKAYLKSNEQIIHIDNDLFFSKLDLPKTQIESYWDVLVQSKEINRHYNTYYRYSIEYFCEIFSIDNMKKLNLLTYNHAYNCGFLGFRNKDIAWIYMQEYFALYNKIVEQKSNLDKYILFKFNENIPFGHNKSYKVNINCILEQVLLTQVVSHYNLYAKEVIPVSLWQNPSNSNKKHPIEYIGFLGEPIEEFGFYHYSGGKKYSADKIYKEILEKFEDNY